MPAGTPEGFLSSLSRTGLSVVRQTRCFTRLAGGYLFSFSSSRFPLGSVAEITLLLWELSHLHLAVAVPGLFPCACWRMLPLHGVSGTTAASLSSGRRPDIPPLAQSTLLYPPWCTTTRLARSSCLQPFHPQKSGWPEFGLSRSSAGSSCPSLEVTCR